MKGIKQGREKKVCRGLLMILVPLVCHAPSRPGGTGAKRINSLIEQTKNSSPQRKGKPLFWALLTAQQELDQIELELEKLDLKLRAVQREIATLQKELTAVNGELARLEGLRQERQDQYNQRLIAVYKYGPFSYLQLLVSAESFSDLVSKFVMVSYFLRADTKIIGEVTALTEEIAVQQRVLQAKKQGLENSGRPLLPWKKPPMNNDISCPCPKAKAELDKVQKDRKQLRRP